ncbi:unnamed protein product, partial [Phaeothamnion confervicola]
MPPAPYPTLDGNGIDLTSGELYFSHRDASVGDPADGGLERVLQGFGSAKVGEGGGMRDNLAASLFVLVDPNHVSDFVTVSVGGQSAEFVQNGANYFNRRGGPETLEHVSGSTIYTFTAGDGTLAVFDKDIRLAAPNFNQGYSVTNIVRPSGEILLYYYSIYTVGCGVSQCRQLNAVNSSYGYIIKYEYTSTPGVMLRLSKVSAVNLTSEYCSVAPGACSLSLAWPATTYTGAPFATGGMTRTDTLNRVWTYTFGAQFPSRIVSPAGVVTDYSSLDEFQEVLNVSNGAGVWAYVIPTFEPPGHDLAAVTDPLSHTTQALISQAHRRPLTVTDAEGLTTTYTLDGVGRISRITAPEGNVNGGYVQYAYDGRGNITTVTRVAKDGSGLPNHVSTAIYPATCTNPKICNKPTSVTEGGFTTDYEYHAESGQVSKVTSPAGANGVRPQTRYTYEPLKAWYYQSASGVFQEAPEPIYRLKTVSTCMTGAAPACLNTADEIRTTYDYGPVGSATVATNLRVKSVTVAAGDGSTPATTTYTHDRIGNLLSTNGPLTGDADTTVNRYDSERQLEGTVGPFPGGPSYGRLNIAVKYTYNADGKTASVQRGPVYDQSDAAWAAFGPWEADFYSYDGVGRRNVASAFPQVVTQYTYDHHRLKCAATRMNPAIFQSLPPDACQQTTPGSYGPDRITQYGYDDADRLLVTTDGVGTSVARNTETRTYTDNGKVATVADGNGNLTTYEYDGHDRLRKTRFPSTTTPGQSSTTDFTRLTYDEQTWRVSLEELRDTTPVTYNYDDRGNRLSKNYPAGFIFNYSYDNLDRMRTAASGGQTLTWTYDVLGRMTAAGGPLGTVGYQYDLAGHRTRMTWPDGYYVVYDVDYGGFVDRIREYGTTSGLGMLATYGFDAFGRRTSLSRGNGVTTTWGYSTPGSLLTTL